MKVLVTGGAGFIASHIVDQLIAAGHQVVAVDNLSTGKKSQVNPSATFYDMDITNGQLEDIFLKERPEVVFHQAAQTQVNRSVEEPIFDATINVLGTIQVLEAARKAQTRKIVFASTAAVYGNPSYLPIDEQHPVAPLSGYGAGKHTGEHYLQIYHKLYGIEYAILRYANVYGVRQDPRGEGGVISIFIDKMLQETPLIIFGDGNQTRDYIYVEDVASANLAAMEGGSGEIFNIGTGISTSINDLIHHFEALAGKRAIQRHAPERFGDIKFSYFIPTKAEQILDWKAAVSLADGLERTFHYYDERAKQQINTSL